MDTTCRVLESCIRDIKLWMEQNFLKLNDNKTEFIIFTGHQKLEHSCSLVIGETTITPKESVRNLSVYVDIKMNMSEHIKGVSKTCYMHLRNISKIRKLVNTVTAHTMVRCMILSRLDYCNALLYSIPVKELKRLQAIQNASATVITGTRKYDHITPQLLALHWLPVNQRIQFKILVTAFKALKEGPDYLQELLHVYSSGRVTSQSVKLRLEPPRTRSKRATCAFSCAAPALVNKLAQFDMNMSIETFRSKLKTELFRNVYF